METDEVNKPVNKRKHNNGESDERSNSMNEDSVMKGYNDTVTVKQTKDSSLWIGGGEVGEYLSKLDWEHHPMGPVAEWPQSLQTAMSILLTSRFSMTIWWGTEFLHVYNDAFIDVVGRHKHPQFLGRPGRECWADVWPIIEPMMKSVVETGVATWLTDHFLPITTHGILEERYFTYSYSPLRIEGGKIGGVFNTVQETTSRVLSERQLKTLKDLAAKGTDIHTVIEASKAALTAFETNTADLPFGICYLTDERMTKLELTSSFGIDETLPIVISEVILGSPTCNLAEIMERVYHSGVSEVMDITDFNLPSCGKWNKQPKRMTISPLVHSTHETPAGILLMGVNQMKILDDNYLSFYSLIANQVATTLANARAHEEERKRAEMLAELDKAKTIFFSNISHEFRTPLTLMLGPLEDMLSRNGSLTDFERENLQLVHRNSLRLLKLVNALLDFSRIEAGRAKANYECVDLSVLTIDLASVFRAACQKEGIDLIVTCPPLCQTVYVDTDMWEKIVLNLLSNAFKFTFKGSIEVKLTDRLTFAELTVTDTGTGIPAEELPKLFERFHRVQGSQGRTHEGTGIGLALVNELAKLHGGSARVESTLGVGTKFIIEIPYDHYIGKLKDKNKNIQSGNNLAQTKKTYTRTASWWMPNLEDVTVQEEHVVASTTTTATTNTHKYTVLLVDDNADMRDYVGRLLCEHYTVILGSNGEEGYKLAVAKSPDVVLTDIMMPVLDGYGLLRALRSNDKTKTIPVIFLSARAGEESKVEGLQSGADDYLVKPFTARELLARVKSHLDTSQLRLIAQKQAEKANEAKDHFLAVLSHELRTPLTPALMLADSLASNPDVPEKIKEDLQLISRNIQLEVHLIDDLLDLTKITKGKLVLNNQFISVHELIGFAYRIVHHDCLDKNIRVDIDLRATLFNVEGDPPRIQQILWNLLKNAVKFTPKGGLITIKSYNVTEGNKDYIHVQVSDSGIGIPPEALPKIFNSFEQGGKDITNQFGGLGLGLAISKALALMHNGTLSAASEGDGKGATFELELPTANSNRVNLQLNKIQMEESVSPASLEILMVEDNKPTLLVMERFIKKLGYNVTTAMSVSEAFDAAKSLKFDLVISDIGLPDGTGHDLIQKIKSLYSVKAIALSGYGMDEDIKKSISAGFDIHVTKPVQLSVLQAAINNVLSSV